MSVANRTVDQANIVGESVVGGANEVSQAAVEGVENVAASSGLISQVSRTPHRRGTFTFHARLHVSTVDVNENIACLCHQLLFVSVCLFLVGGACL